jgi:2-amino-4-hydroxy-6-hydroxymethyldihydropteridine diphosphokinase
VPSSTRTWSRPCTASRTPTSSASGKPTGTDPLKGYLGLGSNVGDRLANLRAARDSLRRAGIEVIASSSVYETEPQGELTEQPDFLNACVAIQTALAPEELLDACKSVERELGRESGGPRHGPRPIDIDLLVLGDLEHRSERLTLPHRDLLTRRFVLLPLLELDPALELPDGTQLADALEQLEGQRVERIGSL